MAVIDQVARLARELPDMRGKAEVGRRFQGKVRRRGQWRVEAAGAEFVLPPNSPMSWEFAFSGAWDRAVVDYMGRYIEPGTVVLDIGASLGLWTVPLALRAREADARVVAFEPAPTNAHYLRQNVALNGLDVQVHPWALGAAEGTTRLTMIDETGGNAYVGHGDAPGTEVRVRALDDIELPGRVSFIKMDTEGYELEVLRGARGLIERDRPVIFGEFGRGWLAARGEDLGATVAALPGYSVAGVSAKRSSKWKTRDVVEVVPLASVADFDDDLLLLPQ